MDLARQHRFAKIFHDGRNRRIGILGGTFNPAHQGHSHIADLAVRHLRLDELWWLVTPQNPLKGMAGLAPFKDRFASALAEASRCRASRRMRVSRLEDQLGIQHSADTVKAIRRRAPRAKLFWVMGADNLAGFHRWFRPRDIARGMAIAVVNRPNHRSAALNGPGARIAGRRISPRRMGRRSGSRLWCFIQGPLNHLSSSEIRKKKSSRKKPVKKARKKSS